MLERDAESSPDQLQRALLRRGVRLEYATLGWNVIGSVIVLWAALAAGSVALAGFGFDSLIEIVASSVVIWELTGNGSADRRRRALRLIGAAFIVLALYVLAQAAYTVALGGRPDSSPSGMVWLAATLLVMLLLAWGKRRTGAVLHNPVLTTEARVTLIDAALAGAILLGLALNAVYGWWWADPLAGLVIVYYGISEGFAALHGAHDL